jgi:Fe-S cluster assembly protein SufD
MTQATAQQPTKPPPPKATAPQGYEPVFDRIKQRAAGTPVESLNGLRDRAFEDFLAHGIPTLKHEDWKYTNVKRLETALPLAEPADGVRAEDLKPFMIPELDAYLMVFVDGRHRPDLSDTLPKAVSTLSAAFDAGDRFVEKLGRQVETTENPFSALNTAMAEDGVAVHVPAGEQLDKPLHVLSVATGAEVMTHPRNLIVAGRGAEATVIESYVALDDGAYFTNALTEIDADDQAVVHHYLLERESERATNMSTLHSLQGERSDVHSHTVLLGGALVRNNVRPALAGAECHCLINGLFVGHGEQHLDNAMQVHHQSPNCRSRQFYKGIMDEHSHGVFTGRIKVDRLAQQTDAIQNNRNMLLTETARMNARPQLEIFADDVRCTHGATTGQVDPEAVFYFRARGLPEDVARAMLIYAFAAEGFDRMQLVPLRQLLAEQMIAKLPMANKLSAEFSREIRDRLYRV